MASDKRRGAEVENLSHNLKVAGSNPVLATNANPRRH